MTLREDLLTPISGDNPAGTDLRYELYDIVREARREEIDAPTGGWDRPRKTADWALVAKETSTAIATRSKDLQLAVWLVEASYHRESFAGFAGAVRMTAQLLEKFWDHLCPALEDGDVEARVGPLAWLGSDKQPLKQSIRLAPITNTGLTIFKFRDSQDVGFESEADDYDKKQARKKKMDAGKMSGEDFDQAFKATPKAWYKTASATRSLAATHRATTSCESRSRKFRASSASCSPRSSKRNPTPSRLPPSSRRRLKR
jgi:type VI secretion system protein ImpA